MSELLAPAGSFAAAIRAFENGADAVYLGLSEFSARRGAVNFGLDELRRLRGAFPDRGLYLALNTLVPDDALDRAAALIQEARDAGIDALIVQDAGIARIARRLEPGMPLHASTQMAVYDAAGAAELADSGFARAVLARECSLEEIRLIRETVPHLELEVFIHGALCYGFSGLCQASQVLLGRSANRGACGQVCRTWFDSGGGRVYPFSQNDLDAGVKVLDLVDLGVASLKIEGRMKSPEYVGSVCARYRGILDRRTDDLKAAEDAALRFSRNQTAGWLDGGKGRHMLNPAYPGPTGITAGRVTAADARGFEFEAARPLGARDGLLWFAGCSSEPVRQALRFREKGRHEAEPGSRVRVETPAPPAAGSEVHQLSRGDGRWPEVKPASFPPAKTPVALTVRAGCDALVLTGRRGDFVFEMVESGGIEAARNPGRFAEAAEKAFGASGDSSFRCDPVVVESEEGASEPFLPPARLKNLRRRFLAEFEAAYGAWKARCRSAALETSFDTPPAAAAELPADRTALLVPLWSPLPFPDDIRTMKAAELPLVGGIRYLPLPPVDFRWPADQEAGYRAVLHSLYAEESPLRVGLNNRSHIRLARRLAAEHPQDAESGRLSFFLDYGLYTVNRMAWDEYLERVPGLAFFVRPLEAAADGWPDPRSGLPWIPLGADFPMPLFISRTCPIRHAGLGGNPKIGACRPDCDGNADLEIGQNGRRYRVTIRDCITVVTAGGDQ